MFKLLVLAVVAISVATALPAAVEISRESTVLSTPIQSESRLVQMDAPVKGFQQREEQQLIQSTKGLGGVQVSQGYSAPLLSYGYSAIPMLAPYHRYAVRSYAAPLYRAFHAAAPILSVKGGQYQDLQDTRQEIKGQSLDIQATKGLEVQSTKGGFQQVQAVKGQEFQATKGADFQAVKGATQEFQAKGDFQAIKGHPMTQRLESWSQKA